MINRIKQIMEYKQMSPTTFADTIQINRSSLTHIFSGRNQPSLDIAKKILNAFPEVNTDWLIMEEVSADTVSIDEIPADPEPVNEDVVIKESVPVKTVDNMLQTDLFGDAFDEEQAEVEVETEADEEPQVVEQPAVQMPVYSPKSDNCMHQTYLR